ncbi:MAG TPA: hypothetical protein VKH64_17700 [Candidatus Binatia bacterium]|nr:hypothetical protein [Candidatus Binatia bacterium]
MKFQKLYSGNFALRTLTGLGILYGSVGVVLAVSEWWQIAIVADPDNIAGYNFGSEAMIANGGWHYASANVYAWSALVEGFVFATALWLLVIAWRIYSWRYLLGAVAIFIAIILVVNL